MRVKQRTNLHSDECTSNCVNHSFIFPNGWGETERVFYCGILHTSVFGSLIRCANPK